MLLIQPLLLLYKIFTLHIKVISAAFYLPNFMLGADIVLTEENRHHHHVTNSTTLPFGPVTPDLYDFGRRLHPLTAARMIQIPK